MQRKCLSTLLFLTLLYPFQVYGQAIFEQITIDGNLGGAVDVKAADMDDDGDLDVVACGYTADKIVWYEREGSNSFTRHTVGSNFDEAYGICVADFNDDGRPDVAGAAWAGNEVAIWFQGENIEFTKLLLGTLTHAHSVTAFDVDGDEDMDLVAAGAGIGPLRLYINDGSGSFTETQLVSTSYTAQCCNVVDIDDDGDMDVLSNNYSSGDFYIFKNDGNGSFESLTVGSSSGAHWITSGDFDGDRTLDLLTAAYGSSDLTLWIKGNSGYESTIIDDIFPGAVYCEPGDFDNDGDLDFVATAETGSDVAWYENNGDATFAKHMIHSTYFYPGNIAVVDFDVDGDLDVLSTSSYSNDVTWWRLSSPTPPTTFQLLEPAPDDTLGQDESIFCRWTSSSDPDYGASLHYIVTLEESPGGDMRYQQIAATEDTFCLVPSSNLGTFSGNGFVEATLAVYAISQGDTASCTNPAAVTIKLQTTRVEDPITQPKSPLLVETYPNPFNNVVSIVLILPSRTNATLEIFNVLGRRVNTLNRGPLNAGRNVFSWNGGATSGTYVLRVTTGAGETVIQTLTCIR